MLKLMRLLAGSALAAALVACGGGGDNAGTPVGGGVGGGSVADFALFTDKSTITNTGVDEALLTVQAVDANRTVVADAPVTVSVDQNGVFTPVGELATDANGVFNGRLGIGSDKTDRDITLRVTVNGITKTISVRVAGSQLVVQAAPSTPAPGQATKVTVTLTDAAGVGIPNAAVTMGGNVPGVSGLTLTTNTQGVAERTFTAPATAGNYVITASGSGVTSGDYQLQVFSSSVPPAQIPAGSRPSLSASPNVLAVNSPGSTANRSTLRFLFLDAQNNPVQNVRVRFRDITTGLPRVDAAIEPANTMLYTDASGSVSAQYISGPNASPTNGVKVEACFSPNDFADWDCPDSVQASLTVAGQALAVSIGDDNLLERGNGTYIKRFVISVADSAGRAVPNAPVDISVDLTHYGKGEYGYSYYDDNDAPTMALNVVPRSLTDAHPSLGTDPNAAPQQRVWCPNEDRNRNGNVDPGENYNGSVDSNGQPTLEPRKADLIISYDDPNVTRTDASGILIVKVEYSQRFATWLTYRVRATTNVAGSQGMAERQFVTWFIEGDEKNGSFLEPAYGKNACNKPN